jgi:hypothetical protein
MPRHGGGSRGRDIARAALVRGWFGRIAAAGEHFIKMQIFFDTEPEEDRS